MNTPDNTDDKDFVMHDRDTEESEFDDFKNLTFEPAYELKHKLFSIPLIIYAVGFLILIILLIVVISRSQDLAEKKQISALEERLDQLETVFYFKIRPGHERTESSRPNYCLKTSAVGKSIVSPEKGTK